MATPNIDLQIIEIEPKKHGSSVAVRSRRADRRTRTGGKPGQKSTFTGQRDSYLAENIDGLRAVKGTHRRTQANFWARFYNGYHSRFNWQLPLDRDPSPDDIWKTDKELTPEEQEEKTTVIAQLEKVRLLGFLYISIVLTCIQQLKSSLRNMDNARTRKERNPWTPLFATLNRISTAVAPRQLSDWQLYMNECAEPIHARFLERWPQAGLDNDHALAFRGKIAREMLEEESDEFKAGLKLQCIERHRKDMKTHALKELPRVLRDIEQRIV